jgi:signal transduction histidine kinase
VSYAHHGPAPALGSDVAANGVRIVQEMLHNVEKHARATLVQVGSATDAERGELRIWVRDDGVGFSPDGPPTDSGGGFGLVAMRERARLAQATLALESTPGAGTCLTLTLPLQPGHERSRRGT